jgi:hypothetical protein
VPLTGRPVVSGNSLTSAAAETHAATPAWAARLDVQGREHVVQFLRHDREQNLAVRRAAFHDPASRMMRATASRSEGERMPVRRIPAGRTASCLPSDGVNTREAPSPTRSRPALHRAPRTGHLSMHGTPATPRQPARPTSAAACAEPAGRQEPPRPHKTRVRSPRHSSRPPPRLTGR